MLTRWGPGKWAKRTARSVFFIVMLPFIVALAFQIPAVQDWTIRKITDLLSKQLETEVTVEKARLDVFDGFVMDNFNIQGNHGDTLLHAKHLGVSLWKSLFSLFQNKLSLKEVRLETAILNLVREEGEQDFFYKTLLQRLDTGGEEQVSNKGSSKPLELSLERILVQDLQMIINDQVHREHHNTYISEGQIDIESLDRDNGLIVFNRVDLKNPVIRISKNGQGQHIDEEIKEDSKVLTEAMDTFLIKVKILTVADGTFYYDNNTIPSAGHDNIDYNHLGVEQFQLEMQDFSYRTDFSISARLDELSFIEKNGFEFSKMTSSLVEANNKKIELHDLYLEAGKSVIRDHFRLKYRDLSDLSDFTNKVYMTADFNDSRVSMRELLYFVPALSENPFFMANKDKTFEINGKYSGRINKFYGQDMIVRSGNDFVFKGTLNARNINDPSRALINLKINELSSNIVSLEQIIPGFKPTENFYRLGKIGFAGRFDGYFEDFVAYGKLNSDIGTADLDMHLGVQDGKKKATYSGTLSLNDFQLDKWSGSDKFGLTSVSLEVKDGKSLVLDNASADINGKLNRFEYKGYIYENLILDGKIEANQFRGKMSIEDENIDMDFDGAVVLTGSLPSFDFVAAIRKLNLFALNLYSEPMAVSGDIDVNLRGNDLSTLDGKGSINSLTIESKDTIYHVDSLELASFPVIDGRAISLQSDIADATIRGKVNYQKVPSVVKQILKENYGYHFRQWKINPSDLTDTDFTFDIHVKDSRNLLDLAGLAGVTVSELIAKGKVDSRSDFMQAKVSFDKFAMPDLATSGGLITLDSRKSNGNIDFILDTLWSRGRFLDNVATSARFNGDTIRLRVDLANLADTIRSIDLVTLIAPHSEGYELSFHEKDLDILGNKWTISSGNSLVLGNKFHAISDLELSDGSSRVVLRDINNKGLAFNFENFDVLLLSELISYDKMDFGGKGEFGFFVSDLYGDRDVNISLDVPGFTINDDPFGKLFAQVTKKIDGPFDGAMYVRREEMDIWAEGKYDEKNKLVDARLRSENAPLAIMEYIIPEGISNTKGDGTVDVKVKGPISDIKLDGKVFLENCETTIDYLGTTFLFDKQTMTITENTMSFDRGVVSDPEGNIGYIDGDLFHNLLQDFRMAIRMYSDKFVMLNTNKFDNPLYYGYGRGEVDVFVSGSFSGANFKVNAITGPGTVLSIPVNNTGTDYNESFVSFVDRDAPADESEKDKFELKGVDVDMNLTLTEDATVEIIFNEKLGDIIRGTGNGDLQIAAKRSGEFTVFGQYVIERGKYLFTFFDIGSKAFDIINGGRVLWTGDPINADLDIRAKYEDLRTSLSVFLQEYLATREQGDELVREATRKTDVDLLLHIGGQLYSPRVSFDLEFPSLEAGELRSYVDSKVRALRENESALNAQVAGLLFFRSFLPYNNPLGGQLFTTGNLVQTGSGTLSEFVSSQFSILISSLLNEAIADNAIFSSVDFSIGLNQNTDIYNNVDASLFDIFNPDEIELQINPTFKFLDEKLSAKVGGNYVRNSAFIPQNSIIPDFALEYFITDDRKLKIRFYGRYDFDEVDPERKQKYGLGLSWRHEFGSLSKINNHLENIVN